MSSPKYLIFFSLIFSISVSSAQDTNTESLDTTISVFWNPNIKLRVKILNPNESDTRIENAVLTLFNSDQNPQQILFMDSLFAYTLQFRMIDMDGDGIKDLLVYNSDNGKENRNYHLYLIDQNRRRLTRVKGFEKVFNPYFDQRNCVILGYESAGRKLILNRYQIDKKGNLFMVTWR